MAAGKRKVPLDSSSDEEDEVAGNNNMGASDSNWEDQETSDEGESKKLRIAFPKKKKVRKKKAPRSPRRGSEPVNIPEDFLSECSKLFIDKRLDDKAARINWGRKQVRFFSTPNHRSFQRQSIFAATLSPPGEDGAARGGAVRGDDEHAPPRGSCHRREGAASRAKDDEGDGQEGRS